MLTVDDDPAVLAALGEALAIVREETRRGGWDPRVVEAFCAMVEEREHPA